jgi:hypothetical protein
MDVIFQGSNFTEFISNFDTVNEDLLKNRPELQHFLPFATVTFYFFFVMIFSKLWGKTVLPGIKIILFFWNGFLAILSIFMFLGIITNWLEQVSSVGLEHVLCSRAITGSPGPLPFWVYIFALSKYAELLDTLWLILSGKPVPFLVNIFSFFNMISIGGITSLYCYSLGMQWCGS